MTSTYVVCLDQGLVRVDNPKQVKVLLRASRQPSIVVIATREDGVTRAFDYVVEGTKRVAKPLL
jgi:hypothetical protein